MAAKKKTKKLSRSIFAVNYFINYNAPWMSCSIISPNHNNPVGNLEEVFLQIIEVYPLEQKLKALLKAGKIQGYTLKEQIDAAIQNDLMTEGEAHRILGADEARQMAVGVDDFSGEDFA